MIDATDNSTQALRAGWRYRGADRPAFAVKPGPGQESVWDYPRPPACVSDGLESVADAAWAYPDADGRFAMIAGYPAFYAQALDCRVDGERVRPQPGGFYGGWVTHEIVGPFKGEPGTAGW